MKLAVFTPGAYIWPVHRNFEAFIASLGESSARDSSGSLVHANLSPQLDARLTQLHREIYDALLRPSDYFAGESRSFGEMFWPDLRNTPVDALLSAFIYFFVRQPGCDAPLASGLSVLRAVFFNHESSEPQHWVHSGLRRLAAERPPAQQFSCSFSAPRSARMDDCAFVINTDPLRPPSGSGWITGRARRDGSGLCIVQAECGLDPSLQGEVPDSRLQQSLSQEIEFAVRDAFGWRSEVAS